MVEDHVGYNMSKKDKSHGFRLIMAMYKKLLELAISVSKLIK